jgi:hypothetical protein
MDGKTMKKNMLLTAMGLLVGAQLFALSQGEINFKDDSELFQHKCGCCHTVGLVSWSDEVLPSEIYCLVERMAATDGANIYCCDDRERLYTYIVNYISRSRAKEVEKRLNCIAECYRDQERQEIERAKARYKK